jgi:hypothetical protein
MSNQTLIQKVKKATAFTFPPDPNHVIAVVSDWLREEGFWRAADVLITETVCNRSEENFDD